MSFEAFAIQHGLIIKHVVMDKWTRVPTEDHPHKRNGAYIWDGRSGAVQNWAIHDKPICYRDNSATYDPSIARAKAAKAEKERNERQRKAAAKAAHIIKQAREDNHPYLTKKGFEIKGMVYDGQLVIPMRIGNELVGCQLISQDGTKKFLYGQRTKGAYCGFDNKGRVVLTEGYATALSVRRALKSARTRYKIYVCFSAANIAQIAAQNPDCIVVADNDPVGIKTAKNSGRDYWVSDFDREDFNDYELRVGTKDAGIALATVVANVQSGR